MAQNSNHSRNVFLITDTTHYERRCVSLQKMRKEQIQRAAENRKSTDDTQVELRKRSNGMSAQHRGEHTHRQPHPTPTPTRKPHPWPPPPHTHTRRQTEMERSTLPSWYKTSSTEGRKERKREKCMKNTTSEGCDRELTVNTLMPPLPFTYSLSRQNRGTT